MSTEPVLNNFVSSRVWMKSSDRLSAVTRFAKVQRNYCCRYRLFHYSTSRRRLFGRLVD